VLKVTRQLLTQKDAQQARRVEFCYLCGESLVGVPREHRNGDHVPPQALFAVEDRNYPLIMPTHSSCNHAQKDDDEFLAQLLSLLHPVPPTEKPPRLDIRVGTGVRGLKVGGLVIDRLDSMICRWVQAFHAALYGEYMAAPAPEQISLPFPEGRLARNSTGGDAPPVATMLPVASWHRDVVAELRKNRVVGRVDRISGLRNGKLRYDCVWGRDQAGSIGCFYAIDVYDWARLGENTGQERRGCVGYYRRPIDGVPDGASFTSVLVTEAPRSYPLDPFFDS